MKDSVPLTLQCMTMMQASGLTRHEGRQLLVWKQAEDPLLKEAAAVRMDHQRPEVPCRLSGTNDVTGQTLLYSRLQPKQETLTHICSQK